MISIQFLIEVSTTLSCQPTSKSQIIFISFNYCKLFSKFVDPVSRALVIDTSWVIGKCLIMSKSSTVGG